MIRFLLLFAIFLCSVTFASAHVVVKPAMAGISSFQTFTVSVPVERNVPTTGLKLLIPSGLKEVTPNVKPGWKINLIKEGNGEEANVTEIIWTGGLIPSGQRDDFIFSAQVPSEETSLNWKAYQTYQDGLVVAWDQDPQNTQGEEGTPYSITKVINDLTSNEETPQTNNTLDYLSLIISILALIIVIYPKVKGL